MNESLKFFLSACLSVVAVCGSTRAQHRAKPPRESPRPLQYVREPYLIQNLSPTQKDKVAELILHLERAFDIYGDDGVTPEYGKELDLVTKRLDECRGFMPKGYLQGSVSGATLALAALAALHLVETGKRPKTELLPFIKIFHLNRVSAPQLADRFYDIANSQIGLARGFAYRNGIKVKGDKIDSYAQRVRDVLNKPSSEQTSPSQQTNEVKRPTSPRP